MKMVTHSFIWPSLDPTWDHNMIYLYSFVFHLLLQNSTIKTERPINYYSEWELN